MLTRSNPDEFFGVHYDFGKLHPPTVDFLSVDAHLRRSGDAEPDLVSIHGHNRDGDATIDDNNLADFACENKHDPNLHNRLKG